MSYQTYFAATLVDITNTGVTRSKGDNHRRDQQRNWETVIQTISILSQPFNIEQGFVLEHELKNLNFGEMYTGVQKIWSFRFAVEHENVFAQHDDSLGRLKNCFNQVPVITGLDETAKFLLPIFYCEGAIKNIIFRPTGIV
jgi:hypothetical protein